MTCEELTVAMASLEKRIWSHFSDIQEWDKNFRETRDLMMKSLDNNTVPNNSEIMAMMTYKMKGTTPKLILHLDNGTTFEECPLPRDNYAKRMFYDEKDSDKIVGFWFVEDTEYSYLSMFFPASSIVKIEYRE